MAAPATLVDDDEGAVDLYDEHARAIHTAAHVQTLQADVAECTGTDVSIASEMNDPLPAAMISAGIMTGPGDPKWHTFVKRTTQDGPSQTNNLGKAGTAHANCTENLHVGDTVWHSARGSGTVAEIDKSCQKPFCVKFESGAKHHYSAYAYIDGQMDK